jgi:hypothetical protein
MKDLPQNELLSAYLDGELTAAEQADVERLLAADPAARQLLDELRTLSSALQSLPQQKLDEDLSVEVLRVAERRMLTEGEPSDTASSPDAPTPLSRINLRRFVNPRSIIWTSLVVIFGVLISIDEHRQQAPVADRKLARATDADNDKSPAKFHRPAPTIRAASKPSDAPTQPEWHAAPEDERKAESMARLSKAPAERSAMKIASEKATPREGEEVALAAKSAPRENEIANDSARTLATAPPLTPHRAKAAKGSFAFRKSGVSGGSNDQAGEQQIAVPAVQVLVVYCDITPEAAKLKSFDKLLEANGIAWHRETASEGKQAVDRYGHDKKDVGAANKVAGKSPSNIGGRGDADLQKAMAAENADFVFVEATPAQVKAALAGLEAQPDVFVSVSVKPSQGESLPRFVHHYYARQINRDESKAGEGRGPGLQGSVAKSAPPPLAPKACAPPVASKGDATALGAAPSNSSAKAAGVMEKPGANAGSASRSPSAANGAASQREAGQIPSPASPKAENQPAAEASQPQSAALPSQTAQPQVVAAPLQRVLFVVRVGNASASAAARTVEKAKTEAAEQASPQPAHPVQSK